MSKAVHLGLSILELSTTVVSKSWFHCVKPKYNEKAKLCYMNTDSFIVHVKKDVDKDIAKDVGKRFDTSNYELGKPIPERKYKKGIGLMKDKLGRKIMTEFVRLRVKTYSYLTDQGSVSKKGKDTKKSIIKRKIKFEDYGNCLETTQLENKIIYLRKNKTHVKSFIENHKELVKNNEIILESQKM